MEQIRNPDETFMIAATAFVFKCGEKLLHHANRPAQIDFNLSSEVFEASSFVVNVDLTHDAGVVDQNVELRKLFGDLFVKSGDRRRIGNVAFKGVNFRKGRFRTIHSWLRVRPVIRGFTCILSPHKKESPCPHRVDPVILGHLGVAQPMRDLRARWCWPTLQGFTDVLVATGLAPVAVRTYPGRREEPRLVPTDVESQSESGHGTGLPRAKS